ncbi:hypothetical protein E2562_000156 [Oryza meyeriana var. granulata]|uniref:Uncharacterized protein n=1 Tax=Oryza meyeriana var. granulata TaxID=110450 RepID=A0A6G1DC14_9ORYZ|nr:hypothetical protein E2562_000156 [Oryza meyeriana var. granulata]
MACSSSPRPRALSSSSLGAASSSARPRALLPSTAAALALSSSARLGHARPSLLARTSPLLGCAPLLLLPHTSPRARPSVQLLFNGLQQANRSPLLSFGYRKPPIMAPSRKPGLIRN